MMSLSPGAKDSIRAVAANRRIARRPDFHGINQQVIGHAFVVVAAAERTSSAKARRSVFTK
jgi:hypothetical protein